MVRPHASGPEAFTYWDYYRQRFERDRGLKIDFVLGSPGFAERVTGAFVDRTKNRRKRYCCELCADRAAQQGLVGWRSPGRCLDVA